MARTPKYKRLQPLILSRLAGMQAHLTTSSLHALDVSIREVVEFPYSLSTLRRALTELEDDYKITRDAWTSSWRLLSQEEAEKARADHAAAQATDKALSKKKRALLEGGDGVVKRLRSLGVRCTRGMVTASRCVPGEPFQWAVCIEFTQDEVKQFDAFLVSLRERRR